MSTGVKLLEMQRNYVCDGAGDTRWIEIDLLLEQGPLLVACTLSYYDNGLIEFQHAVHVHGPECDRT